MYVAHPSSIFCSLPITANRLTTLAIGNFGWLHMPTHRIDKVKAGGTVLTVVGIASTEVADCNFNA